MSMAMFRSCAKQRISSSWPRWRPRRPVKSKEARIPIDPRCDALFSCCSYRHGRYDEESRQTLSCVHPRRGDDSMARWILIIAFASLSIWGSIPCRCCDRSVAAVDSHASLGLASSLAPPKCPRCHATDNPRAEARRSLPGNSGDSCARASISGFAAQTNRGCDCLLGIFGHGSWIGTSSVERLADESLSERMPMIGAFLDAPSAMRRSEIWVGSIDPVIRPWVYDPILMSGRLNR